MLHLKKFSLAVLAGAAFASATWAADPQAGGRLNLLVQPEPSSLMLGIATNASTNLVSGAIFESLLRYDEKLNPQPSLAKSWEISSDGLTYTFHLQDNVKWHDGQAMTSADVKFTVEEFLTKTQPRHRTIMAYVKSVETPDAATVVFQLKVPFESFIRVFGYKTMPIVPMHIYKGTEFATNPANTTPIGTGPFKLAEWRKGSFIKLTKNSDYYLKGKPYLDEVIYQIVPDGAARSAAFETGAIDVLPGGTMETFDIPQLAAMEGACVTEKGWEYSAPVSWLWLNNRNAPLDNPKFRQAIMYALDRELAKDVVWSGYGKIANGPIASTTPFYSQQQPVYTHDLAKAKALLKEIGYDGKPLKLLPLPYGETWQRWAELVKQNLAEAGIPLDIQSTDVAGWNQRTAQWDYDLAFTFVAQNGDPATGVARNYISSQIEKGNPFNNVEGYSNPEVDKLFADAAVAYPAAARQVLYDKVQAILQKDVPVAWLMELGFPTVYKCKIQDLVTTANGVGEDLRDAWIKK